MLSVEEFELKDALHMCKIGNSYTDDIDGRPTVA